MKNALDDINAAYTAKIGIKTAVSYAPSSTCQTARTGRTGRRIHLRRHRLDRITPSAKKKSINEPSRINLLGNSIVLIAPKIQKSTM